VQAIRRYPATGAGRLVERFKTLHHSNILSTRECYLDESFVYALVDDFPYSLEHLVTSSIFPSEPELGAILAQVCMSSRGYIGALLLTTTDTGRLGFS
jgi:hypothetical protein